jgi:hypothetical protein
MGIHIGMVHAGAQLSAEHISERIVSLDTPRTAIAIAQAKAQPVADIRSLDRIGWAFSVATLIAWAIAIVLVRGATP